MTKACEFIRECGAFMLVTLNGDKPACRPFGAITEIEGDLFICAGAGKPVFEQLKANGNVQIVALKAGTRSWVRVSGYAEECFDLKIKAQMLGDCPNLLKYHAVTEDPAFHIFRIKVESTELHI